MYTAYREGWSLYAEYLGHEMNLFEEDPIQLIGVNFTNILQAAFLYQSLLSSFFCTYVLGLYFFGERILAQKPPIKYW